MTTQRDRDRNAAEAARRARGLPHAWPTPVNREYAMRQELAPMLQDYAADRGMSVADWADMYDRTIGELLAHDERNGRP
jgi:hypothetical protein